MTVRSIERLYELIDKKNPRKVTLLRIKEPIEFEKLGNALIAEYTELTEFSDRWEIIGQRINVPSDVPIKTEIEISEGPPKKLEWPKFEELKEVKEESEIIPEGEIPLKNRKKEEIEVVFKKFMREHPDSEYQTPDVCNLLDVPYEKLTRIVGRLKKQGFIYVVNPLAGTGQRKFKLSDSQKEHREENEDLKSLKEGETLEMGVGNNE